MTYQPATISDDLSTLPQLPGWVTSGRVETLEAVAFRSGAALTVLDQLVSDVYAHARLDHGAALPGCGVLLEVCARRWRVRSDVAMAFAGVGPRAHRHASST